jgi:nitronate monooxygenase
MKREWPDEIAMRALRNRFTDRWHGHEDEVRTWSLDMSHEYRTKGFFSREDGVVAVGESVGLINEVESAGEIVERLMSEVDEIMKERPASLLE